MEETLGETIEDPVKEILEESLEERLVERFHKRCISKTIFVLLVHSINNKRALSNRLILVDFDHTMPWNSTFCCLKVIYGLSTGFPNVIITSCRVTSHILFKVKKSSKSKEY